MPISVECLECGEQYRVPDHAAGKRIRCRGCDGPIPVRGPGGARRPKKQRPIEDYDDFDDDDYDDGYDDGYDDDYEARPRRRPSGQPRRRAKSKSGSRGGPRWGPFVALGGIPFLFVGFLIGGDVGFYVGVIFMNIMFGVSSAISTVQKGHPVGLGIVLALFGLLGLLVVSFLPDNNRASPKKKQRRRR